MIRAAHPAPAAFLARPGIMAGGVLLLALALTLAAQRGGVRLSFDSFYYVEFAKEFRHHRPESFGQSWPYGWPLIGAAGGLLGMGAYASLVAAAAGSVVIMVALAARMLVPAGLTPAGRWLTLAAGTCTFLLTVLLTGVFSEVPFAAVLLGLVWCLSHWPAPGAILAGSGLALGALSLRYAGALTFIVLVLWIWRERQELKTFRRLPLALGAVGAAGLVAAALLVWNRVATGHFSGDISRTPVPPTEWPRIASDLGWALPTALGGFFARELLGFGSALRLPLGWILLSLPLLAGAVTALRGRDRLDRALGGLIVIYLGGMVALRCHGHFDDLHNGRMIFPVLLPLFLLSARLPLPRGIWLGFCSLTLLLNTVLCLRGASLAIGSDVRPALPPLANTDRASPILVNEHALSLAAFVAAPVRRLAAPALTAREERDPPPARHIVIAAAPSDRSGQAAALTAEEEQQIDHWLSRGYRELFRSPSLVVLQITAVPSPTP